MTFIYSIKPDSVEGYKLVTGGHKDSLVYIICKDYSFNKKPLYEVYLKSNAEFVNCGPINKELSKIKNVESIINGKIKNQIQSILW